MAKSIIGGLVAASVMAASPALAETNKPELFEASTDLDALSSDEAWEKAIDDGMTDVKLFRRKEIAPGIFPMRMEMLSLAKKGCFVGGDIVGSDEKIARMLASGQQCTEAFRERVNKLKKAGSTTFYVHQMMFGYSIRIDKRGSKEQGNSTCDAFSPFGSVDPIAFACFNDMSGHQRVMGFAAALGQTAAAGVVNFGLMRAQRPSKTIIENGSDSLAVSEAISESAGGGSGPSTINITNNPLFDVRAGATANIDQAGCGATCPVTPH